MILIPGIFCAQMLFGTLLLLITCISEDIRVSPAAQYVTLHIKIQ
jgi:hypothetical protein